MFKSRKPDPVAEIPNFLKLKTHVAPALPAPAEPVEDQTEAMMRQAMATMEENGLLNPIFRNNPMSVIHADLIAKTINTMEQKRADLIEHRDQLNAEISDLELTLKAYTAARNALETKEPANAV